MLCFIDIYGNTIFNGLQMREFMAEWDRLMKDLSDSRHRLAAKEVRKLAERCSAEPHTFLRFIGD
jgi:hypothetical protein